MVRGSSSGYVSPFSISRLNCAHKRASSPGGISDDEKKGSKVAEVIRSRSVTDRGVMLAGSEVDCGGESDGEPGTEAEAEAEAEGETFSELLRWLLTLL